VTVFGQSAGGGSILHQITAYGGSRGPAPFQKAILQSPGFQPFPGHWEQDDLLQRYLALLNVSTIQEARQLPFAALSAANIELVANSPYGTFTFAPAVDGSFSPSLPGNLLAQGDFDTSVSIITGFNTHETLYFTDPDNTNNSVLISDVSTAFPDVKPSVTDFIAQTLYPPVFNGSYPYMTFFERAELVLAESAFTCNTFYLHEAFKSYAPSYGYRFSVPPAYHGEDVPYTYYTGATSSGVNSTIALLMQRYFTRFALTGNPNKAGDVSIPTYGASAQILDLNVTGFNVILDPNDNERCRWWQKSLYY
jgi:cholinesterase